MTWTFHALWMLCGLSAAVFATYVGSSTRVLHDASAMSTGALPTGGPSQPRPGRIVGWVGLALGFVLTSAWLGLGRPLDAAWVGGLVACVAATQFARPPQTAVITSASGALAAVWASLMHAQGLPQPVATVSGAALPLAAAYLSQRTAAFAPPLLQEEALVAMLALGLVVAVAPTISQGWQSALALKLADTGASLPPLPAWLLAFVGASLALGGCWSLWRRG